MTLPKKAPPTPPVASQPTFQSLKAYHEAQNLACAQNGGRTYTAAIGQSVRTVPEASPTARTRQGSSGKGYGTLLGGR